MRAEDNADVPSIKMLIDVGLIVLINRGMYGRSGDWARCMRWKDWAREEGCALFVGCMGMDNGEAILLQWSGLEGWTWQLGLQIRS